ncbi:MAG: hypothetical protein WBO55_17515 [Rhizobiaceae bacterium]
MAGKSERRIVLMGADGLLREAGAERRDTWAKVSHGAQRLVPCAFEASGQALAGTGALVFEGELLELPSLSRRH